MLTMYLIDTYKAYKTDTAYFITWIFELYQASVPADEPKIHGQSQNGALETKRERKRAHKKLRLQEPLKAVATSRDTMSLGDLTRMAQKIKDIGDPPVQMPLDVYHSALRALSSRKQLNKLYQNRTAKGHGDFAGDKCHSNFISIFEKVFKTLTPCHPPSSNRLSVPSASLKPKSEDERFLNRFAVLKIEETLSDDEPTLLPEPPAHTLPPKIASITLYELESSSDGDGYFAVSCIIKDFHRLREYIRETWSRHKSGELDLITAALITKTALKTMICAADQTLESFPKFKDFGYYASIFDHITSMRNTNNNQSAVETDKALLDVVEEYLSVFKAVSSFLKSARTLELHMVKDLLMKQKSDAARQDMSADEKAKEDMEVLRSILPDFHVASDRDSKESFCIFTLDEVVKGLALASANGAITFGLIFALSFFLDIFYELRPNLAQGLQSLRAVSRHVSSVCSLSAKIYRLGMDAATDDFNLALNFVTVTLPAAVATDLIANHPKRKFPYPHHGPFALLSSHPMLCGIFMGEIVFDMQKFSLMTYNSMNIVQQTVHLYNAAKQQQYVQAWQDMEDFIELYSSDFLFHGDTPEDSQECLKRLLLFHGFSVKADNQTIVRDFLSMKDWRVSCLTRPKIQNLLEANGSLLEFCEHSFVEKLVHEMSNSTSQGAEIRLAWKNGHELTTSQLLLALETSFAPQVPSLLFNNLSLLYNCAMLAHDLCKSLGVPPCDLFALFVKIIGGSHPRIMERIKDPAVSWASQEADLEMVALRGAGRVMDMFVKEKGDVETKAVAALMQCLMHKAGKEYNFEYNFGNEFKPTNEPKVQNEAKAPNKPQAGKEGRGSKGEGDFGFRRGFLKSQMF